MFCAQHLNHEPGVITDFASTKMADFVGTVSLAALRVAAAAFKVSIWASGDLCETSKDTGPCVSLHLVRCLAPRQAKSLNSSAK